MNKLKELLTPQGKCFLPFCDGEGRYEGLSGELLCVEHGVQAARSILGGVNRAERKARKRSERLRGKGFTRSNKRKRR